MNPKVYVASSLANWKRVRSICDKLRDQGVEITYDWTQWGEAIFKNSDKIDKSGIVPEEKIGGVAQEEASGVNIAHAMLVIMPGERGSHFEMALAWSMNTPIVILTDGETAERPTSFHSLPRIEQIDDEQEAIDRTVELARAFHLVEKFNPCFTRL